MTSAEDKRRSPNSVLAIATASHMMQHIFVGTSVLFPLIMSELGLNYTEFGVAVGLSALIGGLFQTFFSVASRRIARHVLLGLGNVLLSIGTFLTGVAHGFMHFLGARTIANIGVAPQHPMGTAIVSERFDEKSVGKALGIHYGLAYLGNIVGPLSMTLMVAAIGWRSTLFVLAVPALVIGLAVAWYLSEGTSPTRPSEGEPASDLKSDIRRLLKTRSVVPIFATQALLTGGTDLGIITTYIPLFLADALRLDVYSSIYSATYTAGLLGGVVGPILLGKYADRRGYLETATLSTFAAVVFVYLLPVHSSASLGLAIHLFLVGFASFALPTLLQSHLVRVTQEYRRDLAVGVFFTVGFGFSSLWAGVMGFIIDQYASFTPAFIVMGTLGLAGFAILASQMRRTRKNGDTP